MPELGCEIAVAMAHRKQDPVKQMPVFMPAAYAEGTRELSDKCKINPRVDEIKVGLRLESFGE